jgi:hypothetical protein
MGAALDMNLAALAAEPVAPYGSRYAPPPAPLDVRVPYTARELYTLFKGGEVEADQCEARLALAARARAAVELAIAEGLALLRKGERLPRLGYHLDDYCREVLDLGESSSRTLVNLWDALRARPLLRNAILAGRVSRSAALAVLPLAKRDAEAEWVERAATGSVRALRAAARAAGGEPEDEEEPWLAFAARTEPAEWATIDEALALAGRALPGSSRLERLEAMGQEFLGTYPAPSTEEVDPLRSRSFRPVGPRPERRDDALEQETDRWAHLPEVERWPAPPPRFHDAMTAREVDEGLRELARYRRGWDEVIGFSACAVRESRMHQLLGFATFRQYCEERLGLPARTLEQRAGLERRLWASPALQEARRQGLAYEKLRALSSLPEKEIASWVQRAHALTVIELRRRVAAEHERQMSAARQVTARLPLPIAAALAAAIQSVRERAGGLLPAGRCLAIIAAHFIETWKPLIPRRSKRQRVRARDGDHCTVPGCSHRASHSHHVDPLGRLGPDTDENQTAVCGYHHLRVIHAGYIKVSGLAPHGLTWIVNGRIWGPGRGK